MADPFDPAQDGAQMAFDGRMSYSDYLALDKVLGAQRPISNAPDEMLFIIQHQTSELWMKLLLQELGGARKAIGEDRLPEAFKLLARVSRILEQLNGAWDVLRTMTPSDYTRFRDSLGQSSGFQSVQYRLIEFTLGNRNLAMLRPHAHRPDYLQMLEDELDTPSLYQVVLRHAAKKGMDVPQALIAAPGKRPHEADPQVTAMWAAVYRDTTTYWPLYELAEKLVDLEDYFRRWRFNHVTTVERVIGLKRGTGGTGGVTYLRRMLEVELFPELWRVRTDL
ncbi:MULTISPECIES: tryptophan 2,3-dioxygenase [unclassified Roseitalea]|uniref:tryptophan 2,3-dioxygenase n=1 Tax=unclassified Roseitalea TaxID=2639107 RepID=UPI00273E7D99|nr:MULTISPECIES: tryptophan 2,3-dioxygenase [unclassified Roseitalea]